VGDSVNELIPAEVGGNRVFDVVAVVDSAFVGLLTDDGSVNNKTVDGSVFNDDFSSFAAVVGSARIGGVDTSREDELSIATVGICLIKIIL